MHVPRYWAKENATTQTPQGRSVNVPCWAWSETGSNDAGRKAAERARRLAGRGLVEDSKSTYGYDERLPREEIIDEFEDQQGAVKAFVTRNAYGSLILNTRDLMFIDVDFPNSPPAAALPSFLSRLLGGTPPVDPSFAIEQSVTETARRNSDLGFRVYRTCNGFRVLVTNEPMVAQSPRAQKLLQEFNADPLYIRMCRNQDCFRARLTPKAWRCGLAAPPYRYPFEDKSAEASNRQWEQLYHDKIASRSTCRFVRSIGSQSSHAAITDLITLHDQLTKSDSSLDLA